MDLGGRGQRAERVAIANNAGKRLPHNLDAAGPTAPFNLRGLEVVTVCAHRI